MKKIILCVITAILLMALQAWCIPGDKIKPLPQKSPPFTNGSSVYVYWRGQTLVISPVGP